MRREVITWIELETLIDHLMAQIEGEIDAMVMITRGGIVPGGMLAEKMNLTQVLTAAVDFPATMELPSKKLLFWPQFLQFPEDELLAQKRVLVVDDVWGTGRTITAVKNRVVVARGIPFTCVLHYNPYRNLFQPSQPDYYAAITDAYILYPWEMSHDTDLKLTGWGHN